MPNDRRLLAVFRPFGGLFALALAASALAALFDGGTVVLLIPFLKILFGTAGPLSTGNTTLEAWVSRSLSPLVGGLDAGGAALVVMALLLGALLLKNVFTYVHSQTIVRIQEGVVRDLRKRLFDHLLVVDLGFFQQTRFGQLVAALVADADQARMAVPALLSLLIQNAVTVLTALVILGTISWRLTLGTLAAAPVLLIAVQVLVRRVRRLAGARADERGHMTAIASERLAAMKLIRVSGTAPAESEAFGEVVDRYRKRVIRTQRYSSLTGPVTEVFGGVVLVLVIWGATRPALVGAPLGPEATIAFLLAALKAMSPLKALTSFPAQWATAMAGADRVFRYLDLPAAERDEAGAASASFEREIVFDRVSFRYDPAEPFVLEDVSLRAPRGSVVAVVGPSGAGKTTLVELLPRFWDPTSGVIRIDDVPITRVSRNALRRLMAVVGQDTILLNDTVRANIAYGVAGATPAQVEAAASAANAAEFIAQLPDGYETVLGERGTRLSGGQRQRIAIARALLRDAPILILDEATSALDPESERQVQQAIERLMRDRTVFVIAHRLATVRYADQVLVLDHGRVVERGTHDELLRAGGLYRRLHDLQFPGRQETPIA